MDKIKLRIDSWIYFWYLIWVLLNNEKKLVNNPGFLRIKNIEDI